MSGSERAEKRLGNGVEFYTFAMFILDDIEFEGGVVSVYGILGGAASFAIIGARLVTGREHSQSISWILDMGSDFPPAMLDVINSWNTDCVLRENKERLTTRAWNGYGPNEKRDFKYLTPKLRIEPYMLSEAQVFSKTFHLVCSSERCINIVQEVLQRRERLQQQGCITSSSPARPIFVWEPVPDCCTPEHQARFFTASRLVDVVSPNALELGMMFGRPGWNEEDISDRELVQTILNSGIGSNHKGVLVIRAGKDGSYSYVKNQRGLWLPAYYQADRTQRLSVVDPTGAGNCFLGALAQGMVSDGRTALQAIDAVLGPSYAWSQIVSMWGSNGLTPKALICATVAAGFAVEQVSVPLISTAADGKELWNGSSFIERLCLYTQRLYNTFEDPSPIKHWLVD